MNRWLDCIQILYGCSLGISDNLLNFWDAFIKNKMAAAAIKKLTGWLWGSFSSSYFLILMDRAYG